MVLGDSFTDEEVVDSILTTFRKAAFYRTVNSNILYDGLFFKFYRLSCDSEELLYSARLL